MKSNQPIRPEADGFTLIELLVISNTYGTPSGNYYVLTDTNVTQPLATWERVATNPFSSGNFSFTNVVNPGTRQQFLLLELP